MPGKITDQHIEQAIKARHEFVTTGATRAFHPTETGQFTITLGALPEEWRRRYILDVRGVGIDYVITSYDTPIAWVRLDGVKVVPPVNYSTTTSRLQNRVRAAFDSDYVDFPHFTG